jgi:hypothetical protein
MKSRESQHTVVVLANASELVRHIVQGVVGNEVSDTFNGSPVTRSSLYHLSQTKFQAAAAKFLEK